MLLLLVSAGMATVPGEADGVSFVRDFYEANRTVVVIAQVTGLAAAAAFFLCVAVAVSTTWFRALAAVVALVSGVRAVLVLTGGDALELLAPMAFLVLVLSLAVVSWRSRPGDPG